jgi:putative multiple sugar transport system ATP-binding protein
MTLIPYLSIAENIFLGNENMASWGIDWEVTHAKAAEIMGLVGLKEVPETRVLDLGVGNQQLVEICKALSKEIRLLILDEPTAALSDEESDNLLKLLQHLREKGITSILISHKLREIMCVCDSITIMRDGKTIETLQKGVDAIDEDRVIKGMVGRELTQRFPARQVQMGDVNYEVEHWDVFDPLRDGYQRIRDVSFSVRKGEVLGIAGLMGAGRTELAMSLFGRSYGKYITGIVKREGKPIQVSSVNEAIQNGIAYVSEDRQEYGLVMEDSLKNNITLPNLRRFTKKGSIDVDAEFVMAEEYRERLKIKSYSVMQPVNTLSGGNQQKVVFSRWVLAEADLLILDEPTRGIDVGAKYEIYEVINSLVSQGKSIVFISSDMTELLGMCDRVYVMNQGRIVGELSQEEITQDNIMRAIIKDDSKGAGVC